MNKRSLITILISLFLAATVAWIGNAWIEKRLSGSAQPPAMVKVLVAAKDIPIDTKIDQTFLKLVEMTPGSVPDGYQSSPDKILGKRLKEPVYKGEPILPRRLLDDSAASVLSVTLTPGKRAVAVKVDDIIGVSGFILPGSHVDVIASGRGQGTRTVLQDIKVLTVGQALKAEGGTLRAGSVTLEVDPRQAEILTEATLAGSVRLALRHQMDRAFREPPPGQLPEAEGNAPGDTAAAGQADNGPPPEPESGTLVDLAPSPSAIEPEPDNLIAATIAKPMKSIVIIKGVNQSLTGTQWPVESEPATTASATETTP